MKIPELKSELLCFGARMEETPDRKGGAGPADAVFMKIDDTEISIPSSGNYVKNSPYSLRKINSNYLLLKNEKEVTYIEKIKEPEFYNNKTLDGIPYRKIFLAHGSNCIGTTVFQSCIYWNTPLGCKFCGIGISIKNNTTLPVKTPQQLYAVAESALKENYHHAVLTTGSQEDENNLFHHLVECIKMLKKIAINLQVQVAPPLNLSLLGHLKSAGADTIAINIESFDNNVLKKIAPHKVIFGIEKYLRTIEKAAELFGKNQVISFILAGLGEEKKSIVEGAKKLASIGCYPFIVPFRPIHGTPLGNLKPPSSSYLKEINEEVAEILNDYNLTYKKIKAGCGRCTCCSSLPEYEETADSFL